MTVIKGHCLCKSITFELLGPPNWAGHCYCDSCRRGAGAAVVTFVGHPNGQWRWTGTAPTCFTSSPGNRRYFCPTCGSSLAYDSDRFPDEMHFHAVLLDDPGAITPSEHYYTNEHLPWRLDPP